MFIEKRNPTLQYPKEFWWQHRCAIASRFSRLTLHAIVCQFLIPLLSLVLICSVANSQQSGNGDSNANLDLQSQAAWEYWAYQVKVWVTTDGSEETRLLLPQVVNAIENGSRLVDRSAWKVDAIPAPSDWNEHVSRHFSNQQLLQYVSPSEITTRERLALKNRKEEIKQRGGERDRTDEELLAELRPLTTSLEEKFTSQIDEFERAGWDKLMIIRLEYRSGRFHTAAQEYDLRSRTWGATTQLETAIPSRLGALTYQAMANAFMPITRIDKVYEKKNPDSGRMERWARTRVRALGIAKSISYSRDDSWISVDNESSPVWVRSTDILLPVVRRVTRNKTFESATPIDWTFLVIRERDGSKLECRTQSKDRVPLSGRTGTRIEKLALVIRPPNRETKITLTSRPVPGTGEPPVALANYIILSRAASDPEEVPSEVVGETDFFGNVVIPPSDKGLRLLLIKSGYRPLAKLPVLPGLHDELTIQLPNDQERLYAEGIVRGLENEIKDLLAQRRVLMTRVELLLESGDTNAADILFERYRALNTAQTMKKKINDERRKLILTVKDEMQRPRINNMFDNLVMTVDQFIKSSDETELLKKMNRAKAEMLRQQ